jgi:hypothetical protein
MGPLAADRLALVGLDCGSSGLTTITAGEDSSGSCDSNERIRDLKAGPGN